jgi:hypothetical protein
MTCHVARDVPLINASCKYSPRPRRHNALPARRERTTIAPIRDPVTWPVTQRIGESALVLLFAKVALRLSFSVRLDAIGASPLKLRVDLPANQERQPGDVQPRQ